MLTSTGELIVRSLHALGWSQRDLAWVMGRPYQSINRIIRGQKRITARTALELQMAIGVEPEEWLRLQAVCSLECIQPDPSISERRVILENKLKEKTK